MKKIIHMVSLMLVCGLVFAAKPVLAEDGDPLKMAPGIYSLLMENDNVRVCDIKMKPGDKIGMHSHPHHMLYILSGGKIQLSYADGTSKVIEAQPGQVLWSEAESHMSENVGDTEVHAIIVELKK